MTGQSTIVLRAKGVLLDGDDEVRAILGGKAANIGVMATDLGLPVPPGFVIATDASLLTVTERGYGKRSPCDDYRIQSRGGSGIITIKVADRNGPVVGAMQVTDADDVGDAAARRRVVRSGPLPTVQQRATG